MRRVGFLDMLIYIEDEFLISCLLLNNSYANNLIFASPGSSSMPSGQTMTNTVNANPLFVNYTGTETGDYHLPSTSPAINAGTSTGAPLTDFDGISRPVNTYDDIGAYEWH